MYERIQEGDWNRIGIRGSIPFVRSKPLISRNISTGQVFDENCRSGANDSRTPSQNRTRSHKIAQPICLTVRGRSNNWRNGGDELRPQSGPVGRFFCFDQFASVRPVPRRQGCGMLVAATEAERENERDSRRVPRWSSPDTGIDMLTLYELMTRVVTGPMRMKQQIFIWHFRVRLSLYVGLILIRVGSLVKRTQPFWPKRTHFDRTSRRRPARGRPSLVTDFDSSLCRGRASHSAVKHGPPSGGHEYASYFLASIMILSSTAVLAGNSCCPSGYPLAASMCAITSA